MLAEATEVRILLLGPTWAWLLIGLLTGGLLGWFCREWTWRPIRIAPVVPVLNYTPKFHDIADEVRYLHTQHTQHTHPSADASPFIPSSINDLLPKDPPPDLA